MINDLNHLFAELVQVKNWWISVKTNRMELVTVLKLKSYKYLNNYLTKIVKCLMLLLFVLLFT
jgi:hypothetical protein